MVYKTFLFIVSARNDTFIFASKHAVHSMKTAIIIGATSGIGRQLAISLLEDGWRVGIAGRREYKLMEMKDFYGEDVVVIEQLDITQDTATSRLDTLLDKTGCPDLFLHVAGIGGDESSLDEERELEIVRTHCEGMVRVVTHFMGYVKNSSAYTPGNKACIGVITSVAGTRGMGVSPAYSASPKMQSTYIAALSQYARIHKIPVTFSDIRPGFVATDILLPGTPQLFVMPVNVAATHILKGLERRKWVIVFDWRYRVIAFIWEIIPRGLWERITFVKNSRTA